MKRFTSYRKQLLLAGMCLLGLSANAQYSTSVSKEWDNEYKSVSADFKLTDVATTLGTDTTTLVAALNAWQSAEASGSTYMFRTAQKSGDYSYNYTGNFGEFWMDQEGEVQSYGSSAVFFAGNSWDALEDRYTIYLGNYPDTLKMGATIQHTFGLFYNDNKATFDITFTVTPSTAVEVVVPEPASLIASGQNVVGTTTSDITRTNMQGYDATTLKFDAKPIKEALGIDSDIIAGGLSSMLYMQDIDSLGVRRDSLTAEYTASAPGFWMKNTVYPQGHELQGENSGLLGSNAYGSSDALYAEFSYDSDADSIFANVGQYPGTCKVGDKYEADFYIIYGDKAYKLVINTEIVKAETENISDFNEIGSLTYNISIKSDENSYQNHSVTIDVDAIATALTTTTDGLAIKAAADDESFYVGNTANQEGFWFDESGIVCTWGTDATTSCVENATSGEYDVYNCMVAIDPSENVGKTYTDKIYFINGSDAFVVNFIFNIEQAVKYNQKDWEIVAKRPVNLQIIPDPSTSYHNTEADYTITVDQISELIGTSDPVMYVSLDDTLKTDSTLYATATKYPCDPAPGAWLGDKGQGSGWGSSAVVGLCYSLSTGKFTIYEMPDASIEVGTTYTAPVYFVNEETHQMLELDFSIQWVNEVKNVNIVGSENITALIASMDDTEAEIDLTNAATALNVTVSDLLDEDNYYFTGLLSTGTWSEGATATQGFTFKFDGSADAAGTGDYSLSLSNDGKKLLISCSPEIKDEDTFKSQPSFGFVIGDNVYVYYLTLYTESSYAAGINNVNVAPVANGAMYNVAGQRIAKAQKGLYIMNGKKYIK